MIEFAIPGPPLAQGRARATVRGGFVRMYDPKKSKDWKAMAGDIMRAAMGPKGAYKCDVGVEIEAVFARPKSAPKSWPSSRLPHAKRGGDVDNIAKAVLDAGNGICWEDDCLVWRLLVVKSVGAVGEPPYVYVTILPPEELR